MAGAGAGPYSHLHLGITLKHFKSGHHGCVLGWGTFNGDPHVHLYFPDMKLADKLHNHSKCYAWCRMSRYVPLEEPLVEEKVFKDADEYCAKILADECHAKKMAEGVKKPVVPKTPPGKKGAAAASSTNVAMQDEPAPEHAKIESVEVDNMLNAATLSFADDDDMMVEEPPKERMKNEYQKRKRKNEERAEQRMRST